MRTIQISDLKMMLIERIDELARELAPDGVRRGAEWVPRNPTRGDRRRGSFVIRVAGPKIGSFVEYADDARGDVIDLIAYLVCGARKTPPTRAERIQAFAWARQWLGLEQMTRADVARARRASEARLADARAREEVEALRRRGRARMIFLEAQQPIEGTLVDVYLASRGIELKRIAHREHSLRFAPRLTHWLEPHVGPAMVAIFRNPRGSPTAVHVTWLREDGRGKADVEKPKMMLGQVAGAVIRLSKGPTGLTPEEHAAAKALPGCCCLTEGIEDGLTAALACPEYRCWAAGSLGNLAQVPGLACVSDWVVCADNDWDKPAARRLFRQAVRAIEDLRRGPVGVARSWVGKDINDLLRAS